MGGGGFSPPPPPPPFGSRSNPIPLCRIERIAQKIVEDVQGPLVVVCVLKGGHQVFADLVDYIKKLNTVESMVSLCLRSCVWV